MKRLAHALLGLAAAAFTASGAWAEELRVGVGSPPGSIDPHFENTIPNIAFGKHIFDHLIVRDHKMRHKPGLAVSWKPIDDTTWEIKLRQGVTWHDGSPFTADDVIFTFSRAGNVPKSPQNFMAHTSGKEFIKIDDHTLHIKTEEPNPMVPNDLATFAIVSKKHGEGATTEDYNSGKAAIGTGPYRFVEWVKGDRYVLEANADYWGGEPQWDRVVYKPIESGPSRVAALLSGEVDVIDAVPTVDVGRLRESADVEVHQSPSNRIIYLTIDSSRDVSPFVKSNDGEALFPNPLRKWEVRKAISKAIDRKAIVEHVMEGLAVASGQIIPEGFFAYSPALPVEKYDPEGAKALLAKVGLADGFRVTVHGPNNRYVNDAQICEAVAQMLTRVGIRSEVHTMPKSVFFAANAESPPRFSITLQGYGAATGGPEDPLRGALYTHNPETGWGFVNDGRYSNERFDVKVREAIVTVDPAERERLWREATEIAMNDLGFIPLHQQVNVWATRQGLAYEARSDENTLAMSVTRTE